MLFLASLIGGSLAIVLYRASDPSRASRGRPRSRRPAQWRKSRRCAEGFWDVRPRSYSFRARWIPWLPLRLQSYVKTYAPLPTFDAALEAGFSSGNFNLSDNVEGDSRAGLDDQGLNEVRRLMDRHSVSFDEARLMRQQKIFRANGIDPATGLPMDKKAITRL